MSSQIKLSLLALVSTAAAIPHYGGHSRFHNPSGGYGGSGGAAYPTGGWGTNNSTQLPLPSGTGANAGDGQTTTVLETGHTTETIVSTIYATRPASGDETPVSAGANDVSSGANPAATGGAVCGPGTITVTATNKVTVTVPPGGASTPSGAYESPAAPEDNETPEASEAAEVPASSAPGYEVPAAPSSAQPAPSSHEVEQPAPSSEAPVETPAASEAPVETPAASEAPAPSSEAPASSVAETSAAASSSKAATPSGSPSYSGSKRGLAYEYNEASLCKDFDGAGLGFAYNWAQDSNGDIGSTPFAPMIGGPDKGTSEEWLKNVDKAIEGGSNLIMGFNECDQPGQCNLSPDAACESWLEYMNPIAEAHPDVTILGPSVTNGAAESGMGLGWLKEFQDVCPEAVWHAANIHFYDELKTTQYNTMDLVVERFQKHIEDAASQTGKKVWVTEFGLWQDRAYVPTTEENKDFLGQVMDYMEGSSDCEGYAYFMVGTKPGMLNTGSGGLSEVGRLYASGS